MEEENAQKQPLINMHVRHTINNKLLVCVCLHVKGAHVRQANLVLITLYLFHQRCALAYFRSYKFTSLPSVVIDDPLILAHL